MRFLVFLFFLPYNIQIKVHSVPPFLILSISSNTKTWLVHLKLKIKERCVNVWGNVLTFSGPLLLLFRNCIAWFLVLGLQEFAGNPLVYTFGSRRKGKELLALYFVGKYHFGCCAGCSKDVAKEFGGEVWGRGLQF